MAAGVTAAGCGRQVTLLDDNPSVGGQIWRGGNSETSPWFEKLAQSGVAVQTGSRVISADAVKRRLLVERNAGVEELRYSKLILATGAGEFFIPFPGWTLPNVMGVGGLQALVKSGLWIAGKRIIVAGSGPLLLAVAAYLRKCGATVVLIAEQADARALGAFGLSLAAHPSKLWQAIGLNPFIRGMRYLSGCWIERANGLGKVERVVLRRGQKVWEEHCDYVANAYGFVSNTELADLMGCEIESAAVKVDKYQKSSLEDVYCAGETAGVGGVDTAVLEGQVAGYSTSGRFREADNLLGTLRRARSFAARLDVTFKPRNELRSLAGPETIVCRCEDVTLERLKCADSWRSAKLHERCGMGPCQGRICGPAVRFLFGWEPASIRQPVFPTKVANLIRVESGKVGR